MFGSATYLSWLAVFLGLPLLLIAVGWHAALWAQRRALGWTLVGALVGGWLWDGLAIRVSVWYYDPRHLAGLWLLGMPLEEWLWIAGVALLFGSLTVVLKSQAARRTANEPVSQSVNQSIHESASESVAGDAR